MKPVLYLRLKKKVMATPGQPLTIKDLCRLTGEGIPPEVGSMPVCVPQLGHGNYLVIDVIDIIQLVQKKFPMIEVQQVGPHQMLVEVKLSDKRPRFLYVMLVSLVLFAGSGLAIMNFHTDVSMAAVHERIVFLLTGQHVKKPLLLQIPYSIGIGVGMMLFFNRLFQRKFNEEPSPLELETFQYQETIDQYMINDEKQEVDFS
ncbi:stage V sporulation protein AA [Laceyella sacchari]|jgi:stage V sporulation protein AA|uniref:Stage V sporulation protein AA n=1 Tax=Laceyella tengchongensis TaxID=574699 RepID=A0AA45WRB2_9BACL|nr:MULTISPECIES: stage V sporulation protein AA [Laceyella]KPC77683.1 stage V sporulation protein AA [Thermoactinomyces vulgaris]AUS08589.1 stage V sporulation protein AA [Laceyella sacchari]MRG28018.1 stage V sporulation protein AA [Laceyella tengchongensis]TCW41260.1 stage V sporulation protein AA [Laceyella sacchari]SMP29615.1 stage V sporulation protein AA [Laceyella tengchongensis]